VMLKPNLLTKRIYSPHLLEQEEVKFKFPGFADLIIAFYTIYTLIMQIKTFENITEKIPEIVGLLFVYSVTFSVSTLHIVWRTTQLSESFKRGNQYRSIALLMIIVMAFLTGFLFKIPAIQGSMDNLLIARRLILWMCYPNAIILFLHTWLWLAHADFLNVWAKLRKNKGYYQFAGLDLSILSLLLLIAPYLSYFLNVSLVIRYS